MNFLRLANEIIADCFKGYGLTFEFTDEEIFEDEARIYFSDSIGREFQVHIVQEEEEATGFSLYIRSGEDWLISCSGELR